MVALGVGAVVIGLTFQFYIRLQRDYQAQTAVSETQLQLSQLHTSIGNVLRSAGSSDAGSDTGFIWSGLLGGRLWMPSAASSRLSATCWDNVPGGASPRLGFGMVSDNWNNRADVFDVSYFNSGGTEQMGDARSWAQGVKVASLGTSWDGSTCSGSAPGGNYVCANLSAPPDADANFLARWVDGAQADITAGINLYFTLTNGYHGCLVQLTGTNSAGAKNAVSWVQGTGINANLSSYCGDGVNNGPFSTAVTTQATYCTTAGNSARPCYLIEFGHSGSTGPGPARIRRYYVCGPAGTLASQACCTANGASSYTPTFPELHAISIDGYGTPRDVVAAMGVEDAQISYQLAEFANKCENATPPCDSGAGSCNCPCPDSPCNDTTPCLGVTPKNSPHVTSALYDSDLPGVIVGGVSETEDGCDDEARWIRRVTLSLLTVTDGQYSPFQTALNRAGLRGLNPTFGGAADASGTTGANYLRRLLRIDAQLRVTRP